MGSLPLQRKEKGNDHQGGGDPTGSDTPQWGTVGQPCFASQTNSCTYGNGCRCQRATISQEERFMLKTRRDEAYAQRNATGAGAFGDGSGLEVSLTNACDGC